MSNYWDALGDRLKIWNTILLSMPIFLALSLSLFVGGCHFGGRYHFKTAFDKGYKAGYDAAKQGRGPKFPFFWNDDIKELQSVEDLD